MLRKTHAVYEAPCWNGCSVVRRCYGSPSYALTSFLPITLTSLPTKAPNPALDATSNGSDIVCAFKVAPDQPAKNKRPPVQITPAMRSEVEKRANYRTASLASLRA